MTLDQQTARYHGRSPGFDLCRLVLALSVLVSHSVLAAYGSAVNDAMWRGPLGSLLSAIMPMFFALSGFLVMGSIVRTTDLRSFIVARGLRIVPALLTEIVISAVVIGPTFTYLPLGRYVADHRFAEYLLNVVGHVSYMLPGVFAENPFPDVVNVSLWTIPPEITCYVFLSLMTIFRFRVAGYLVTIVGLIACNLALDLGGFAQDSVPNLVLTRHLFLAFTFGNAMYLFRSRIPFRVGLFAAATVLGLVFIKSSVLVYPAILCLSYSVIYVGCSGLRLPVDLKGDYSYGIYLYGFPVQQAVSTLFPDHRSVVFNIALCLPVVCLCAFASWWIVEKPTLEMRKLLPRRSETNGQPGLVAMLVPAMVLTLYETEVFRSSHFLGEFNLDRKLVLAASLGFLVVGAYLRWLYLHRGGVGWALRPRAAQGMTGEPAVDTAA